MKHIFKYTLLAAVCAFAAAGTACSDETDAEKDKGATPVIKYARPCDISVSDSLLTKAPLGAQVGISYSSPIRTAPRHRAQALDAHL